MRSKLVIPETLESTSMSLMKKVSRQDESDSDNEEHSNAITSATYTSKDGAVRTNIDIESSASGRPPVRNIFSKSSGNPPSLSQKAKLTLKAVHGDFSSRQK